MEVIQRREGKLCLGRSGRVSQRMVYIGARFERMNRSLPSEKGGKNISRGLDYSGVFKETCEY